MSFALLDYLVIILYFAGVALIGILAGRREKNTEDYFLAERRIPWWAVTCSILATEVSAVTFIGVPGEAFRGNYVYLQFAFGSLLGRILIAFLFLPAFYRGRVISIYQYLKQRFGENSRLTGAAFFYVTRVLADGVRLLVVSLALQVVTGYSLEMLIIVVAAVVVIYTLVGGIKAVIWTDVAQFAVFMGGAWVAIYFIMKAVPGGWAVMKTLVPPVKFKVFDFSFSWVSDKVFLIAFINGCFQTFAALGADQDLTQRMLTCRSLKQSQRALLLTGIIDFPIVLTFLFIGTGLYCFYAILGHLLPPAIASDPDRIFPHFIMTVLPAGVRGLLIAAVFAAAMSTLASAVNALASSAIVDVYKPFIRRNASEGHYLRVSRAAVAFFGVVIVLTAFLLNGIPGGKLWLGFKVTGFTYGALLGIFLLGVLTRGGNDRLNAWAMVSSAVILICLTLAEKYFLNGYSFAFHSRCVDFSYVFPNLLHGKPLLAWPWYVVVGTAWTYLFGWLGGLIKGTANLANPRE